MEKYELLVGEHFIYKNIEWIVLDNKSDENGPAVLAMTAKPWREMPFNTKDIKDRNNWAHSTLREILNSEFLSIVGAENLKPQQSDLIADNGDDSYGITEDYVTILSCDQYRKYRKLVPLFDEWMWTLTPWNCWSPFTGSTSNVRYVGSSGYINDGNATYSYGVAPACVFLLNNFKIHKELTVLEEIE